MSKKEIITICALFFVVTVIFFYKMFLLKQVPFPGDLLISEYNPWKSYSYLGYNPGSYPSKAQFFDTLRQLYPWKTLMISMEKHFQVPLWNPYNFSGTPLLANFQSSVFYPLNIIYIFLPQVLAWSTLIFLQPFLAGLWIYFYARKMSLSQIGSFFTAISYAFSSFLIVWLEYNTVDQIVAWFPLILLSLENLKQKTTVRWSIIFVISIVFAGLSGHPQLFGYALIFVFIYAISRKAVGMHMCFLFLLSLGTCAIQLIPGIELMYYAARSPHTYTTIMQKILIQPWQLSMLLVPDYFGNPATRNYLIADTYVGKVTSIGAIPLFFSIYSIFRWKKHTQIIRFFCITGIIILLLITANPITSLLYRINLPMLSASNPTLMVFIFCFSLSILAGYGLDKFMQTGWKKDFSVLIGIFLGVFLLLFLLSLQKELIQSALKSTIYELTLFLIGIVFLWVGFLFPRLKHYCIIVVIFLVVSTSWRAFIKFTPFVPGELVYPSSPIITTLKKITGINRVWGVGAAYIEANFTTQLSLFSPDGYDPLYPKWYGEFIQAANSGRIQTEFTDKTRSDADIPLASSSDFQINQNRLRVLQILGVRYILDRVENASTQKTFPIKTFNLKYNQDGWKIFENTSALPRFFLVNSYLAYKNPTEFSNNFFSKSFSPRKTILLEKNLHTALNATLMSSKLIFYSPNNIEISTHTNGNALLFLSDTYYPGWVATIDGLSTQVLRADYAFRSIVIPSGSHQVRFTFQSQSFKMGSYVSLISIVTAVIYLSLVFAKKKV